MIYVKKYLRTKFNINFIYNSINLYFVTYVNFIMRIEKKMEKCDIQNVTILLFPENIQSYKNDKYIRNYLYFLSS